VCPYGYDLHAWVQVLGVLSLHSKLLLCHMVLMQLFAGSKQEYCADTCALLLLLQQLLRSLTLTASMLLLHVGWVNLPAQNTCTSSSVGLYTLTATWRSAWC
jgi:hypothetical protein